MSEPRNSGKNWTREEDGAVIAFIQAQDNSVECWKALGNLAQQLGRSVGAVEGRIHQLAFNVQKTLNAIEVLRKAL